MNKRVAALFLLSIFQLTGCSQDKEAANEQKAVSKSNFSDNNVSDIKKDYENIKSIPALSESENTDFQYQLVDAVNSGDTKKVEKIINQMKGFSKKYNHQLDSLNLKSSEVNKLRNLLKEFNDIAIEVAEFRAQKDLDMDKAKELESKMNNIMLSLENQTKLIDGKVAN